MKKIVFLTHGLSANGIETFLVNILRKINKSRFDVSVIIAIDKGVFSIHEQELVDMGIHILHAGDLDGIAKKLQYFKNLRRYLREGKYDAVHTNMDLLNGIVLFEANGAGITMRICHAHNSGSQYKPAGMAAPLKRAIQKLYAYSMRRLLLRYATIRLACSDVAARYFYGEKDYQLIYNSIDFSRFPFLSESDRTLLLPEKNTREVRSLIVSVGRISMQKNPFFVMEIIDALRRIRTDFYFVWIGTGDLENETKKKADELGIMDYVTFTGVRTDVPELLPMCDCFLMPSLFEGLPFSLIEAQAAGLKCLVSDAVTKDADMGAIRFYPLDSGAEAWARVLSDLLDASSPVLDESKRKRFDIIQTTRILETVYDSTGGAE